MAKKYLFRISLQQAEFDEKYPGWASIVYGGSDTTYQRVQFEGTLPEALAERERISAEEPRSHVAMIGMARIGDRCPNGFKAIGPLYKEAV